MEQSHKLFVLIDKNLSRSQQAVQACHAVANFAQQFPEWKHQSMVLLAVDGEDRMWDWLESLDTPMKALFREPYWNDRLTAIAAYGCDKQVSELELL